MKLRALGAILALLLPGFVCAQVIGPAAPAGSPTSLTGPDGSIWTVVGGVVQIQTGSAPVAPAGFSQNVILLVDVGNTFWQENSSCLWWGWAGNGSAPGAGWMTTPGLTTPPAGAIIPPCSTAPPVAVPSCYPKVQWPLAVSYGTLPAGVSTRYDSYAVWVCNTPGGYITWTDLFTFSNMAVYAWRYATGTWTAAQGQADCQTSCVPPTPTEAAFQQTIMTPVRPKALVAFNGASLTRSVYTVNADGTLNGTPLPGVLVAVAAPCDETKRIPVTPLPGPQAAAYYSVAGDANTLGGTIPENSYTICSVALPIGAN